MRHIVLLIFIIILSNVNASSQSIGFTYKSSFNENTTNIHSISSHNTLSLLYLYKNILLDIGLEKFDFYENAHITDSFISSKQTFYSYVAKGNRNTITYLAIAMSGSFKPVNFLRFNSGLSIGYAFLKDIKTRTQDNDGNFIISFNASGKDEISNIRLKMVQSLILEKTFYWSTKLYIGYELSSVLNSIIEEGNLNFPNSTVSDLFNSNLVFGFMYSF